MESLAKIKGSIFIVKTYKLAICFPNRFSWLLIHMHLEKICKICIYKAFLYKSFACIQLIVNFDVESCQQRLLFLTNACTPSNINIWMLNIKIASLLLILLCKVSAATDDLCNCVNGGSCSHENHCICPPGFIG
jgi:hypothetical protein